MRTQSRQIITFLCQTSKWPEISREAKVHHDALVRLVAGAGLSVRIVNGESFKNFCHIFEPKYRELGLLWTKTAEKINKQIKCLLIYISE